MMQKKRWALLLFTGLTCLSYTSGCNLRRQNQKALQSSDLMAPPQESVLRTAGHCPLPDIKDPSQFGLAIQPGRYKDPKPSDIWSTQFIFEIQKAKALQEKGASENESQWQARYKDYVCHVLTLPIPESTENFFFVNTPYPAKSLTHDPYQHQSQKVYYGVYGGNMRGKYHNCYLQHGKSISSTAMYLLADHKFGSKAFFAFVETYYGWSFIRSLLDRNGPHGRLCTNVIVGFQESNESTLLEMTERTEWFMKHFVCNDSGIFAPDLSFVNKLEKPISQNSCALIGHSKGGATATNIARRCRDKTSLLEKGGCEKIKKIYSSSGAILGVGLTILIKGLAETRLVDYSRSSLDFATDILDLLSFRFLSSITKTLSHSLSSQMPSPDTFGNPLWYDINPLHPMEDNRPLAMINKSLDLRRKGYWQGEYGAAATSFDFNKSTFMNKFGCGANTHWWRDLYHRTTCHTFGLMLYGLRKERFTKETFLRGFNAIKQDMKASYPELAAQPSLNHLLDDFSFDNVQVSDGIVEYRSAMDTCHTTHPDPADRLKYCHTFADLNHHAIAGGAPEAQALIGAFLAE